MIPLHHMISFIVLCKFFFGFEGFAASVAFDDTLFVTVLFNHMLQLLDVTHEELVAIGAFVSLMCGYVYEFLVDRHLLLRIVNLGTKPAFEDASFMSMEMGSQRGFVDERRFAMIAFEVPVMHAHVPLHLLETIEPTIADDAREDVALKLERQYLIFDIIIKFYIVLSLQMFHNQLECVNFTRA